MATLKQLLARLRAFVRGGDLDRDFAQELESHVEMLTEDHIRTGMAPDEARRAARLRVGLPSSLAMQHRDVRAFRVVEELRQDLSFTARLLVRDRWLSVAAIAAIALGIGANTLGFTIINAAFLRGFSFEEADRLYAISWNYRNLRRTAAVAEFDEWRAQATAFSAMGGYSFGAINISDDLAMPEQTQGSWVTANLFDVLRQRALVGRTFTAADQAADAGPVVIIGYEIWSTRFNRDPGAIGRTLRINGLPATIIGVMPERMKFPDDSELWLPFVPTTAQLARTSRPLAVIARLADGESRDRATAQIDAIGRRILADHPEATKELTGIRVETLIERFLGSAVKSMFITVMGAVIFVLLIACANVASLLLSRSVYRTREIAVRCSMGATRSRIVRQLLVESIALSAIGGMAGLVLATAGVDAFDAAIQVTQPPYWLSFTIDYRVLAYVAGICVLTGVLFGMAPALHLSNGNHTDALKDGGRGAAGGRRAARFGSIMVVAELTLTVILLSSAGLMIRSFSVLYLAEPGFDLSGLYRMRLQLPPSKYPTADDRYRFYTQLEPRLGAIAGVSASAITTGVPPLDGGERVIETDRQPWSEDRREFVGTAAGTADYFTTLGLPILRGRAFTAADGTPGNETVIINQRMGEQFFPGEDPLGRRLRFAPESDNRARPDEGWRTIVGVIPDILQGSAQDGFRNAVVYTPLRQNATRTASLLVRSSLDPSTVMTAVRRTVQSVDADQPVFSIQSVAAVFDEERIIYRIFATLFAVLAAIAVSLSAIGLYAVSAYAVTQRTQEIGVRVAVGAQRWQVGWLFLKRGLVQVLIALAVGIPASLALAMVVRLQLVEIEPTDPVTLGAIVIIVASVALASCVVPVRKASRVDPMNALRSE